MVIGTAPGSSIWSGPGAGLVFGVDVVPVTRAQQLLDRYDAAISARVATPAEASWIGVEPVRLGAVLALKEAAIKALAGRPEPFRWQLVSTGVGELVADFTLPPAITPGGWPPAVAEVIRGFAAGMGLEQLSATPVRLAGAGLDRAQVQLAPPDPGSDPEAPGIVAGLGGFGVRDDHVLAAVCFWRESDDE